MSTAEDRFKAYIQKNILWVAFAAVLAFGAFLRYTFASFMSPDTVADYIPWMQALQSGGIRNLLTIYPAFPYSAMHVYLWAIAAGIFPYADALTLLKGIVIFFDAAQIAVACLLVWEMLPKERKRTGLFTAFTLLWLNPILLMNGAAWGQTDCIYAGFSVLSLLLLFKRKPALAMLSFGLALALKLQAIFLLPVLMILYFCYENKFSIWWFLLIPAVWVAAGIPLRFFNGGAASNYLSIQTGIYVEATLNMPNVHALLGDAVKSPLLSMVKWERYAMILAFTTLLAMAAWMLLKKIKLDGKTALLLGAWSVLICVFLLPHMHERYGIVGEILLLLWAVVLWKPRGFLYVLLNTLPLVSAYSKYLLDREVFSLQFGGVLSLILMVVLTWELIKQGKERLYGG